MRAPIMPPLAKTSLFACFTITLALTGCGGNEPPAKDASIHDKAPKQDGDGPTVNATSEIGGMNEDDVDATFNASVKGLQRCIDSGAKRVEFLGGSVAFLLKIDGSGKVSNAYLEHSTLGDRTTERCMLDALSAKSWPKPVGGAHGLARKSFSFDPPNDVRPPTTWDDHDAAPGLKKIASDVGKCKQGRSGPFEATLYVGTNGKVMSASVTPPDEGGEAALDCLVGVLESASFPSPGSWPAKVTLQL
jgi:hypothetical protein